MIPFLAQRKIKEQRGIAALIITLLVGGVVVEVAISGLVIAYFLNQSGYGASLRTEALGAARSGIDDAVLKIIRDKTVDYTTSGSPYALAVGARSATVTICKDARTVVSVCDTPQIGKDEITSVGQAVVKQRKLRAIVNIFSTAEVSLQSLNEISL